MRAAGSEHRPSAVAAMYRDLLDGFVVDERDQQAEAPALAELGLPVLAADTLARRGPARSELAAAVLRFGAALPASRRPLTAASIDRSVSRASLCRIEQKGARWSWYTSSRSRPR